MALYEYNYDTGGNYYVDGDTRYGQQFTVGTVGTNENNVLTFIKIRAYRCGNPGTVSVDVQAVDGFGHPSGVVLSTGSFNGNTISTEKSEITIEMTSTTLAAATQYVFTIRAVSGDGHNYLGVDGTFTGCFMKYTKILMADGTVKDIQDVKKGDFILGYTDIKIQPAEVTNTFYHQHTPGYYVLIFEDGTEISVTGNHPIYGEHEYIPVEQLKIGDNVTKINNGKLTFVKLIEKEKKEEIVESYNFSVADTKNYFAYNILFHNK